VEAHCCLAFTVTPEHRVLLNGQPHVILGSFAALRIILFPVAFSLCRGFALAHC